MQKTSDNLFVILLISISGVFMLIVSFILLQIRAQNRLLKQKRKLAEAETQHQKDLLHSVIKYQEDDRKRIAQNLHDDVGGTLAVLRMLISNHLEIVNADNPEVVLIDRIISNVRDIAHNLSPQLLEKLYLWEVVEELCENLNKAGKLEVNFECTESAKANRCNGVTSLAIFRVLQELITNTLKHAGATRIDLSFDVVDGRLVIDYRDDGKGLSEPNNHAGMGMNNIVSRLQMLGASWDVRSEANKGYNFVISLPGAQEASR